MRYINLRFTYLLTLLTYLLTLIFDGAPSVAEE